MKQHNINPLVIGRFGISKVVQEWAIETQESCDGEQKKNDNFHLEEKSCLWLGKGI